MFDCCLQDQVGVSCLSGVDQQGTLLKLCQRLSTAWHRLNLDGIVRVESEIVEPAEGCGILVLAADRLVEEYRFQFGRHVRPRAWG